MTTWKAKTEFIYLQGKASWARLVKPNAWDAWAITLHPNQESLEKVRELQAEGMKNVIKKDDDGYYVQFKRPVNKMMKGKVVAFTPPIVVDKEGKALDGTVVGNGSDVTVKLCIYQHGTPGGGKAKASRLEAVRVDTLVPFNPDKDFTDEEKETVSGLSEQPEQLF